MVGQVAAFAHFGITLKNDRWSWSGRSPDGKVVLTIWRDEIDNKSKPPRCNFFGHPRLSQWRNRPGNHERIENLKWAREHCDGLFGLVLVSAVDLNAEPRKVAEAYPTKLTML
jgi:hypothetical protein